MHWAQGLFEEQKLFGFLSSVKAGEILALLSAAQVTEKVICAPDGHSFSMPVVARAMAVVIFPSRFLFQMMLRAAGGGGIRKAPMQTAAKQMNFAALLFLSLPVSCGGWSPECCLWTAAAGWNFHQAFGVFNSKIFSYLGSVHKKKKITKTTNQRNNSPTQVLQNPGIYQMLNAGWDVEKRAKEFSVNKCCVINKYHTIMKWFGWKGP